MWHYWPHFQPVPVPEQDYLYGRYGALPHLGSVDRILDRIADLKSAEAIPPSLNDSGIALSSAVNAQEQE